MDNHPRSRICLAATVTFFAALLSFPVRGAELADPNETRRAIDAIVERLNALDTWFSEAEEQRVRWEKDLKRKDNQVAEVAEDVEDATAGLKAVANSLEALQQEQRSLNSVRAEQAAHIADHLAATYRISGQDFFKLLMNQESPATFDRMTRYHRYFTEARIDTLKAYQQTLADLELNQLALEERAEEQKAVRDALTQRQLALVREREQRKGLIAELDLEAEDKISERSRLESDRGRLEKLLTELLRRASDLDGRGFLARKGSLPWPLRGRVSHGFGQSRADGRLSWHGMVIAADEGKSVQAVYRGRVIFADWLRGFGLLTIVDHGSGLMTLYGHADILLKTVGEWVESGETIARAGRSGGQRDSGLYFEVRQKGEAKDPIGWLEVR